MQREIRRLQWNSPGLLPIISPGLIELDRNLYKVKKNSA